MPILVRRVTSMNVMQQYSTLCTKYTYNRTGLGEALYKSLYNNMLIEDKTGWNFVI